MVEKVGFLGRKLNILSLKRTMIFGLKKKIKKVEKEQNLDLNQDYDVKKNWIYGAIGFVDMLVLASEHEQISKVLQSGDRTCVLQRVFRFITQSVKDELHKFTDRSSVSVRYLELQFQILRYMDEGIQESKTLLRLHLTTL